MSRPILSGASPRRAAVLALVLAASLAPAVAHAHFVLKSPENWKTQDSNGLPEKTGQCGNENDMSTGKPYPDSGKVTAFTAGDKIMITINEAIAHPGHYYVALGLNGETDLPALPATTNKCGTVTVQSPPVFPVLGDNILPHTMQTPLNGDQTFEITLPADKTCTKCRLQVIEYMQSTTDSNCFYRHCADISISAASGGAGGMGSGGMPSGGASGASAGMGQGGSGVAAGMGGVMGQAGMISAGGMVGASGSAAGGRPGTAGAVGMSGAPGTAGMASSAAGRAASSGGAVGAGGSGGATGTGGAGGTGTSSAGGPTGMPVTTQPPDDAGGCGLARRGSRGPLPYGAAGALALGVWLVRRRRS
jgi:hypothetical protein